MANQNTEGIYKSSFRILRYQISREKVSAALAFN